LQDVAFDMVRFVRRALVPIAQSWGL